MGDDLGAGGWIVNPIDEQWSFSLTEAPGSMFRKLWRAIAGAGPDGDTARGGRVALSAIGALQGVLYWFAYRYWPAAGPAQTLAASGLAFVVATGLTLQFAYTGRALGRLLSIAAVLGLVFAMCTYCVWSQVAPSAGAAPYGDDSLRQFTWLPAAIGALYVLTPYVRIYQRTGRGRFPYTELFQHSWCNGFIGALGLLYVGVFQAVVHLWAWLFAVIGVAIFDDVFGSPWFTSISSAAVFGYGVARGRESTRVLDAARGMVLAVFRLLLPVLSSITVLFLAALPVTGLMPLWDTGHPALLLYALAACTVLFLNAAFEDGAGQAPYVPLVRAGVQIAIVLLPVVAGLGLIATGLRVGQYGLTPERFFAVLIGMVTALYSLGYAASVFIRSTTWMGALRSINVALSFVLITLAVLVHTPVLDPLAWSARSQYARLAGGRVDPRATSTMPTSASSWAGREWQPWADWSNLPPIRKRRPSEKAWPRPAPRLTTPLQTGRDINQPNSFPPLVSDRFPKGYQPPSRPTGPLIFAT